EVATRAPVRDDHGWVGESRGRRRIAALCLAFVSAGCSSSLRGSSHASFPPTARIFVVDESRSAVLSYAPAATGDVAPDRVVGRALTGPGIAVDSTGRTYVANAWLNTISIFAPGATGDALPIATIRGGKTGLDSPEGIALDRGSNLYVANSGY